MKASIVAASLTLGSALASGQEQIRIEPLPAGETDAKIAWLADAQQWRPAAPTFEMTDAGGSPLAAKGWLAATDAELLIRLDVTDAVHLNKQTGDGIWNGDFVRIAVDGAGDGSAGGAKDLTGLFGPDDASIGFALTPTGPQGHTYSTTQSNMSGAYPAELLKFSRDDAQKLTRYEIRIPWERLATRPGVAPAFGIVVQVRNVDEEGQREPVHIVWGEGANEPKPGLFKRVALANPPHELIAAAGRDEMIWESGDRAQITVAVASDSEVTINASAGDQKQTQNVPGSKDLEVRRYRVSYAPTQDGQKLAVELTKGDKVTASASSAMTLADPIVQRLSARMDQLIASAKHPLFLRHLRSVKAMVQDEWARATLYKKSNAAKATETLGYIQSIATGMDGDAAKWESYYKDGRPLFMAFVSGRDGTLQWYTITLPEGWDPAKSRDEQPAYSMMFELHGAGNPHYLVHLASQVGTGEKRIDLLGYDRPKTYAMIERKGYHVFPYGRGNSGYRDIGETDVWEAYRDAQQTVKIDPDRRYLYGFSMGGGGTWNLGSRTPDEWAAIAILGMGARVADWGQAQNVSYLPIFVWGGETDDIAYRGGKPKDIIERFRQAITAAGGSVDASTTPDIGHNYLGEVQERSAKWLQQHTRKRPTKFSFTADTDQHRGVWGITMSRDLQVSPFPSFDCAIDGQTVQITTKGTNEVQVDFGEDGLNMQGDVVVMLNGKEAYKGPAKMDRPLRLQTKTN